MAIVQLDRRCIEVTSDDGLIRYGFIIENEDEGWLAISLPLKFERSVTPIAIFKTPYQAFEYVVRTSLREEQDYRT